MAMPQTAATSEPRQSRGGSAWLLVILAAVAGLVIAMASGTHLALAGIMIPLIVAAAWASPRALLLLLVVWMTELGLLRRLIPGGSNSAFSGDPVLIIGPMVIAFLFFWSVSRGALDNRTRLANVVLAFNVVALVEVINPGQGSILAGLGGLLFLLMPVLSFWVGRILVDDDLLTRIIWAVAVLGVLAGLYGLYQQFVGFPSWDQTWINSGSYTALALGNNINRAFGSMSSSQEYAAFLGVSLVAWVSLLGKKTRLPLLVHLAAMALILMAIFYESERTIVFLGVMALAVVYAAWRRAKPSVVVVAGVVSIVVLIFGAGFLGGGTPNPQPGQSVASTLANHQLNGLSDPTSKNSSLHNHILSTERGFIQAFQRPFGSGVGSVTLAASKFNASSSFNSGTEFDPGNMGVAFGVVGVLLYLLVTVYGLGTAYRAAVRRHDALGLFVLGVVAIHILEWFNGDLYSVTWLVWLVLGYADMYLLRADSPELDRLDLELPAGTHQRNPRRWIQSA